MNEQRAIDAMYLSNQIWKVFHSDRPARAYEHADVTIPAVISVLHVGKAGAAEMQHIHWAHIDARTATVASVLVNFDPRI